MRPLDWQVATVAAIRDETSRAKSFTLALPDWTPHRPGQHYDVRLTAQDGYRVQRSYSIASEPERVGEVDLTIERIDDGEVSPYFHDVVVVGDRVEVRGPIGGYFVWEPGTGTPLLLVAGGSGVVPLMAMLRHRRATATRTQAGLVYSSRTLDDVIYRTELDRLAAAADGLTVIETLTREAPPGWTGYTRRIDGPMIGEALDRLGPGAEAFICGPTLLVEAAAEALVGLGLPPERIRTERFGPTGR